MWSDWFVSLVGFWYIAPDVIGDLFVLALIGIVPGTGFVIPSDIMLSLNLLLAVILMVRIAAGYYKGRLASIKQA